MAYRTLFKIFAFALTTVVVSACATKPTAEWQDDRFSGPVDNILIIGASAQPTMRRLFEDTFVAELAAIQVKALSSYKVMPVDQVLTREKIEAAIAGQNMDAVLVSRLLGVEDVEVYNPPTYYAHHRRYHSYYAHALESSSPGYLSSYKVLTLETNLYDTATQQLVWSMQSESIDPRTPRDVIETQINLTITTLAERGIIALKP